MTLLYYKTCEIVKLAHLKLINYRICNTRVDIIDAQFLMSVVR